MNKVKMFIKDPVYRFGVLNILGFHKRMTDEEYLKKLYYLNLGQKLDLENPQKFSEKLQWLKIYDRNPLYSTLVDKCEVKKYVASKIGEEHVIPMYGVWNSFDDIDFDSLPDQFVLKCTHDSGSFAICRDKKTFDKAAARTKLEKGLKRNYFRSGREWAYKNVRPRILAEKYIDTLGKPESYEYKLTCMGGQVKIVTICTGIAHDAFEKRTNDNYDRDLNHLPWYAFYKNSKKEIIIPDQMSEIIRLSEVLSKDIPQVRVDWYIVDDIVMFGEMTFYTWNGFIKFTPPEWDDIMGQWLVLPEKKL